MAASEMTSTIQLSGIVIILFCLTVQGFLFPPSNVDFHPPSTEDINRCTTENQTFTCTVKTDEYNSSDIIFYEHNDDVDSSLIQIVDNQTAVYHVLDITHRINSRTFGCYVSKKFLESQNVMRVYEMPKPVPDMTCIILDYTGDVTCNWNFGTDYTTDSQYPKVTLYVGFDWTPSYVEWTYDDLRDSVKFTAINDTVLFNQLGVLVGISVASKCGITQNRTFEGADVIKIQPYPVVNFQADILNSTCMSLTWTHNKKMRIKQYLISYTSKWDKEQVKIYINETKYNKNISKEVVCQLVPWTTYTFTIKVKPLDEPGIWGQQQEVIMTTPEDVPASSPVVVDGSYSWKREECSNSSSNRTVVIFMKAIPKSHEHGSNIHTQISMISQKDGQTIAQTNISGTSCQLQLHCNQAYDVILQAFNSQGLSANTSVLKIAAANEDFHKQFLVERSEPFDGKVYFEWNFNDVYRDGIPTVFYARDCKDPEWKEFDVGVSNGSLLLPNNVEPDHYCYGFTVTTQEGNTGFEWNSCQYIKDIAPKSSPADLRVVAGNQDNTLLVTWSKWLCPPGEPYISHFQIAYCLRVPGTICAAPSITVYSKDLTFVTISDLDWEKEYAVQIRAVTRTNEVGPWSQPVFGKPVNKSLKGGEIAGIAVGGVFVLAIVIAAAVCCCRKFGRRVKKTLQGEHIETLKIIPGPKEVYTSLDHNQNADKNVSQIINTRHGFDLPGLYVNVPKRQTSIDSGIPEDPMTPPANLDGMTKIYEEVRGEINEGYAESPSQSRNQSPGNDSHINSYVTAEKLAVTISVDAESLTERNIIDHSREWVIDEAQPSGHGIDATSRESIQFSPRISTTEPHTISEKEEPMASIKKEIFSEQNRQKRELSKLLTKIPVPSSHLTEDTVQTCQQDFVGDHSKSTLERNEDLELGHNSSSINFPDNDSNDAHISGSQAISSYAKGYLHEISNLGVDDQHLDNVQVSHDAQIISLPLSSTNYSGISNHAFDMDGSEVPGYVESTDLTNTTKSDDHSQIDKRNTSRYVANVDATITTSENNSHQGFQNAQNTTYVSQADASISAKTSQSGPNTANGYVSNIDSQKMQNITFHICETDGPFEGLDEDAGNPVDDVFQMDDVNTPDYFPHPSSPSLPNTFGYVPHSDFTESPSNMPHMENKNGAVSNGCTSNGEPNTVGSPSSNNAKIHSTDYVVQEDLICSPTCYTDMTTQPTYLSNKTLSDYVSHTDVGIQSDSVTDKSLTKSGLTSSQQLDNTKTETLDYIPLNTAEILSKAICTAPSSNHLEHTEKAKIPEAKCSSDKFKSDELLDDYAQSAHVQNTNKDQAFQVNYHGYIAHDDMLKPPFKYSSDNLQSSYNNSLSLVSGDNASNDTGYLPHNHIQTTKVIDSDPYNNNVQCTITVQALTSNSNKSNGTLCTSFNDTQTTQVNTSHLSANNLQGTNKSQIPSLNDIITKGTSYITQTKISPVNKSNPSITMHDTGSAQSLTSNGNETNGTGYVPHNGIQTTNVNDHDPSNNNLKCTDRVQALSSNSNESNGTGYISHSNIQTTKVNVSDSSNNNLQGPNINLTSKGNESNGTDNTYNTKNQTALVSDNISINLQNDNTTLRATTTFDGGYITHSDIASDKSNNLQGSNNTQAPSLFDGIENRDDGYTSHSNFCFPPHNQNYSKLPDNLSNGNTGSVSFSDSTSKSRNDYNSTNVVLEGQSLDSLDSLSDYTRPETSSSYSNPSRNRLDSRSDDFLSSGRSDYSSMNELNEDKNDQSQLLDRSEPYISNDSNSNKYQTKYDHHTSQSREPVRHESSSSGSFGSMESESSRNSSSDSEKEAYVIVGEDGCLVPVSDTKQSQLKSKTHESQTESNLLAKTQQNPEHLAHLEQNEVF